MITNREEALEALDVEIIEVGYEYGLRDNSTEVVNKIFDSIDNREQELLKQIRELEEKIEALQDGELPSGMKWCRYCDGQGMVDDF